MASLDMFPDSFIEYLIRSQEPMSAINVYDDLKGLVLEAKPDLASIFPSPDVSFYDMWKFIDEHFPGALTPSDLVYESADKLREHLEKSHDRPPM